MPPPCYQRYVHHVIIDNVNEPNLVSSRDRTRAQLVEVAAELLATGGPDAVTTRSVALAAGVQAPAIYRLFGDKGGLLDAVVEHGFASYMARKPPVGTDADPVEGLRAGWELHIGFGLAHPGLFRLMHTALRTPDGRAIAAAGAEVLRARVHRVAEAGRLRVTERRAVELISAAGTGVVFTLIDQPDDERDEALADTAWASVCAAILTDPSRAASPGTSPGPAAAAVTLRAALPSLTALTPAERALLSDWLDRIAESPGTPPR
jgi:AcrR family transcriptional regulator